MPLSEEDRRNIALRYGKDIHNPHVLAVANAAYALGVERARKVRALEWCGGGTDDWRSGKYEIWRVGPSEFVAYFDVRDQIAKSATLDAAQAHCQAHHAIHVLSFLEDI